jgi:hypothetical protein
LLQQDQKLSAASSDEERLAAGIFTIGLQAKRLFLAQRKNLKRERKPRERTWTENKPPRKTPSSQDMGVVVSSGGVKDTNQTRAHRPCRNSNRKIPGALRCRLGRRRKL